MIPEAIEGEEPTVKLPPEPRPYRSQVATMAVANKLRAAVVHAQSGRWTDAVLAYGAAEFALGCLGYENFRQPSAHRLMSLAARLAIKGANAARGAR